MHALGSQAVTDKLTINPHSVAKQVRSDGTILLTSKHKLSPVAERTSDWLHLWAQSAPQRTFLAERSGAGWREVNYQTALDKVRSIASNLLGRGLDQETPIIIMSGNSVDHGLLSLAAQYVGIPTVPVAEQYSLVPAALDRLKQVIELVKPNLAFVGDVAVYANALSLDVLKDVEIVATEIGQESRATPFAEFLKPQAAIDLDNARAGVTANSIAKILMTSGSTSTPKGVETTQRMLCANQAQIADALPLLRDRPPRVVDWLPWNHVFGGSHNFNMMLANGGSYYIDQGKPVKGKFEQTLENLSLVTGTLGFNVPVGFAMLLKAMRDDRQLRHRFFEDLDMLFYAGASLPQDVWHGIETMAQEVTNRPPLMTSSWGMTETAPSCLMQHEPINRSGVVGVPLNGVTVKLLPDQDMRCEVRVKGPNVFSAYHKDPEKTAQSFDSEGFLITGDAMVFVDESDVNKGMKFDGRMSEDFKLLTGTWVRAANLRLQLLTLLAPLANDVIVTGADLSEIGVMVFPDIAAIKKLSSNPATKDGAYTENAILQEVAVRLQARANEHSASSTRVARAIVLSEPASMAEGEVTAKGNLNFRKVLTRRNVLLDRLYDDRDPATIKI